MLFVDTEKMFSCWVWQTGNTLLQTYGNALLQLAMCNRVLRVMGQYDCDLAVVEKLTTFQSWTFTDSIPWVAKMILSRGRWIII